MAYPYSQLLLRQKRLMQTGQPTIPTRQNFLPCFFRPVEGEVCKGEENLFFNENAWYFLHSKRKAAELRMLAFLILLSGCWSLWWGSSPGNCWGLFPHVQFKWFLPFKMKDCLKVLKKPQVKAASSYGLPWVGIKNLVIWGIIFECRVVKASSVIILIWITFAVSGAEWKGRLVMSPGPFPGWDFLKTLPVIF